MFARKERIPNDQKVVPNEFQQHFQFRNITENKSANIVQFHLFKNEYNWMSFDLLQRRTQLTLWSKHTAKSIFKKERSIIFGYLENEKLLGTIWLRIDNRTDCHVVHFMVDPEHQKEGIGTKLLQKAILFAQSKNCSQLSLEVRADNDKARRFYEKNGFIIDFIKPRYYNSYSPKKYIGAIQNCIQPIIYDKNGNYFNDDGFHCVKKIM